MFHPKINLYSAAQVFLEKTLHLSRITSDTLKYKSKTPFSFSPFTQKYYNYGLECIDSYSFYSYGKMITFNDESIKDKFYVTDINPCIFMTQPPSLIANNKISIVYIEGIIKSKAMKVDLIQCALDYKVPLIIYDYSYDLIRQKLEKPDASEYYIQRYMVELFQKWTNTSGKNIIITMGDSYLEVLKFLQWEETHEKIDKSKYNLLNISPFLNYDELDNMHLHIENYIIAQLQRIIYKLYVQCEENTTQIDDKYLDLFLGLRNKHCFLTRFEEEKLRMLPKRMNEKNIMKHWIFSKNELFLNRQYDFEERMKKCQEVWQGCVGEDHFYLLNEFSVLRKMNVKNNPVVNILSALLKNENKSL